MYMVSGLAQLQRSSGTYTFYNESYEYQQKIVKYMRKTHSLPGWKNVFTWKKVPLSLAAVSPAVSMYRFAVLVSNLWIVICIPF